MKQMMNLAVPKFILFILGTIFFLPSLLIAKELPIRTHLIDATEINQQRILKYAALSKGRSYPLSRELILMEELALIATINLDLKASKYIEQGVDIIKNDLIDMDHTPKFQNTFKDNLSPTFRINIDIKKLKAHWLMLVKNDDLNTIYNEALDLLDHGILKETNQNCLTRHFIESIARSILNLDNYRTKAKAINLEDPKNLSVRFIKTQLHSLPWAYSLDKRAYPIQKDNIPLFCQDVPPIAYK